MKMEESQPVHENPQGETGLINAWDARPLADKPLTDKPPVPVVCSYTEWDPLEEAIVGVVDGAVYPDWHPILEATMPEEHLATFRRFGGQPFPQELIDVANAELNELSRILEAEGVTVRRPVPQDQSRPFSTPDWDSAGGLYAAMPRDVALIVGDEIIEAPMAWRCRYFELHAFRSLFRDYFCRGARWSSAPKPQLRDELYNCNYDSRAAEEEQRFAVNELEPTFDAADFVRCGRDIFGQRSHVTNRIGIEWLRRHLGDKYRIHVLEFDDDHSMHIDATFMPLAPGKLLVNPERVPRIPEMFSGWDVLYAPQPEIPDHQPLYMTSKWLSMNLLVLDEERIIVEQGETKLAGLLSDWGFEVIPCPFRNFNAFGGSFHCAVLDVRRNGQLQSYF